MNLDQYRAMVAQEKESQTTDQTQSQKDVPVNKEVETEQTTADSTVTTATAPVIDEIEIEGIGRVKVDELKNGYLRQADYTKKTQMLSAEKKEVEDAVTLFNYLKSTPELAKELAEKAPQFKSIDPASAKVNELENRLAEMALQLEVKDLLVKYPSADTVAVINTAKEKHITLEEAYKIVTPQVVAKDFDEVEFEKKLREKILKELATSGDTRTIVSTTGNATNIASSIPELTTAEKKVARNMKLSDDEYLKWKHMGSK